MKAIILVHASLSLNHHLAWQVWSSHLDQPCQLHTGLELFLQLRNPSVRKRESPERSWLRSRLSHTSTFGFLERVRGFHLFLSRDRSVSGLDVAPADHSLRL